MPMYEYECEACAHRFERIQKFSDAPIDTCPKCGSKVRKLISSPAIQFKGSGFYITDYPKSGSSSGPGKSDRSEKSEKSDKSSDSKSSESSSSESGSSTPKTESKSQSKSESKAESKS